jgi:hypothetical protein
MHAILPQPPEGRPVSPAGLAEHSARHDRIRIRGAVRGLRCPLCGAFAYGPCKVEPPGDHLGRWLAAYKAAKITKAELGAAIAPLVIITANELVPERAA